MELYNSIFQRKSSRKYDMQPLEESVLNEIEEAVKGFKPLYPELKFEHRYAKKAKGQYFVKAPHYLVISGQGLDGEMEAAGFLYQQLVLWLDARGIGSVWLGSTKDAEAEDTSRDIIVLAFGNTLEDVHRRERGEFKRKNIEEITNAPDDVQVQAAHFAPSGINLQPWYFEKEEDEVFLYEQKLNAAVALIYKLADLDVGIALCHYALACEEQGTPFSFRRETQLPVKKGFTPFGVIG
jgi:nitroreductase